MTGDSGAQRAGRGVATRLHVVGAGLIGTSIALAAVAAGWSVSVEDADEVVADRAQALLDTIRPPWSGHDEAAISELVCVAVPPAETAHVMLAALTTHLTATVMDVSSVKAQPQQDLTTAGGDLARVVWTHPLAGSERSGPDAAASDLFAGRTWVVCPQDAVSIDRRRDVLALIAACGGRPLELGAAAHDRLLAYTSHLPQLVASALATEVAAAFEADAAATDVPAALAASPSLLAGPGLLDMTRLAASQPELWSDVAALNHEALQGAVGALVRRLGQVQADLADPRQAADGVRALVESGGRGRAQLDRKHPGAAAASRSRSDGRWVWVRVTIDDVPGTLARVFALAADLEINIEDVHVDHAPHTSRGEVSVAVAAADAARLRHGLSDLPHLEASDSSVDKD